MTTRFSPVRLLLASGLVLSLLTLLSCNSERDTWGNHFIPDNEKLDIREAVISNLKTWTDTVPALTRKKLIEVPIGEIYDPTFGKTLSYFLGQYFPDKLELPGFDKQTVTFDSVFFRFRIKNAYQQEPLLLTLSRLNKRLELSDTAHKLPQHRELLHITTTEIQPKYRKLVTIPLGKEWARVFLDSARMNFASPEAWFKFCKGFRLDAKRKTDGNNVGSMFHMDMSDPHSGIFFYWKQHDSLKDFRLTVTKGSKSFAAVEHHYTGSKIETVLTKEHNDQDAMGVAYLKSGGDLRTVIDLSEVYEKWRDSMPLTILRAELRIPLAAENAPFSDTLVSKLFTLLRVDGKDISSDDLDRGAAQYDGYYNRLEKYYSLNLTYTIQELMLGHTPVRHLYLVGDAKHFGYGRAILGNEKAPQPMQLHITYTRY